MGKKRHSLGSKVRPKKKNKKSKKKWKKHLIEPNKLQRGIEDLCSQFPEISLNAGVKDPVCATQRFLNEHCGLSESAFDPVYKRKKEKKSARKKRIKLLKCDEKKFAEICSISSPSYENSLLKKDEKNLCQLLDNLTCKPVTSPPLIKQGFIYSHQDAQKFRKKVKSRRDSTPSGSD